MQLRFFLVYRDHIVIYRLQEMYSSSTFPRPHKRFMVLRDLLWRGSRIQLRVSGGDKPRSELWKYKQAKLRLPQMHDGQLHMTLQRTRTSCCDISQHPSTCGWHLSQCPACAEDEESVAGIHPVNTKSLNKQPETG